MTENRDLYLHDYYYYSSASSPFTSGDPYQLMATPTDHYPPTMATTTTAYPDYFQGSSTSTSTTVDYNALARALGGDHPPSSYNAPDVFDPDRSAGGKWSSADMDALLMDSSAISAGGGGGGDGSTTGGSRTPASPNSSVSSSSTEAAGQEEEHSSARRGSKMVMDHEVQDNPDDGKAADSKSPSSSKKQAAKATAGAGGRKKGEKRQRQPRFAFMTKSEVDHLEDGYRWRKYGQKAVKNSPYPRSYYRCTTQKCTVKKRVERSHQDPSVVITTYEGQHTHPSPAALRGAAAGAALPHSHMLAAAATASHSVPPMPGFRRDILMLQHQQQQLLQQQQQQRDVMLSQTQDNAVSNSMQLSHQQQYHATQSTDHHYHHQQLSEFAGHQGGHAAGLLQDMVVPSSFFGENLLQQSYRWNT